MGTDKAQEKFYLNTLNFQTLWQHLVSNARIKRTPVSTCTGGGEQKLLFANSYSWDLGPPIVGEF